MRLSAVVFMIAIVLLTTVVVWLTADEGWGAPSEVRSVSGWVAR